MIRTPLLPIQSYSRLSANPTELNIELHKAYHQATLNEALAVSSTDLLQAFNKLSESALSENAKNTNQIRSSLLKYFIRLSTRPTPFGLFSGISMGQFGSANNILIF